MRVPGQPGVTSAPRPHLAVTFTLPSVGEISSKSSNLKPSTPWNAAAPAGKSFGTAVWVITALGKASAAHQLRQVAQFQVSVAQVKALGTAQNPFATAVKPSGTPVPVFAPVVKAFTAAADASATGVNALPTAATEAATGANAVSTVPQAFATAAIAFPRSAIAKPTVPDPIIATACRLPTAASLMSHPSGFPTLNPDRV
jgi:hypothetical protein